MNVCSKCGKKLRKNDKVCPNCGKKVKMVKEVSKVIKETKATVKDTKKDVKKVVEKVSDTNINKKNSKTVNTLFWILGLLLPPVGLVLYLMWRKTKKESAKNVGTGALVAACIYAFLGLSLLIDTNGAEKKDEVNYQIYNADINEWVEATKADEPVITVIGLTYCQYCKQYNPVINEIAKEKGYKLYWFDADDYDEESFNTLTSTYELSYEGSSPYTLVTKNGEVIGEHVEGYMNNSDTEAFLSDLGL